jgi:hypothetical protein
MVAPLLMALFQLGSIFADFDLILKIVGLLMIMSFVRQHVQNGALATILIIALAAFLLFDGWGLFGAGLTVYLAVTFGAVGLMVDIFFFGGIQHRPQGEMEEHMYPGMNKHATPAFAHGNLSPEEAEEMHHLRERLHGGGHEELVEEEGQGEGVSSQEVTHRMHAQHRAGGLLQGMFNRPHHPPHRGHR